MTSKEKIVEIINKYLWKFDVDKLADELFEEFEKDLDELDRAEGLLKALLQDMYVEYSGKDEVYIIKGVYNKKSKVYQQIQEYFKNL